MLRKTCLVPRKSEKKKNAQDGWKVQKPISEGHFCGSLIAVYVCRLSWLIWGCAGEKLGELLLPSFLPQCPFLCQFVLLVLVRQQVACLGIRHRWNWSSCCGPEIVMQISGCWGFIFIHPYPSLPIPSPTSTPSLKLVISVSTGTQTGVPGVFSLPRGTAPGGREDSPQMP